MLFKSFAAWGKSWHVNVHVWTDPLFIAVVFQHLLLDIILMHKKLPAVTEAHEDIWLIQHFLVQCLHFSQLCKSIHKLGGFLQYLQRFYLSFALKCARKIIPDKSMKSKVCCAIEMCEVLRQWLDVDQTFLIPAVCVKEDCGLWPLWGIV